MHGACDMFELFRFRYCMLARLCFSLNSHRKITLIFCVRISVYKSYSRAYINILQPHAHKQRHLDKPHTLTVQSTRHVFSLDETRRIQNRSLVEAYQICLSLSLANVSRLFVSKILTLASKWRTQSPPSKRLDVT